MDLTISQGFLGIWVSIQTIPPKCVQAYASRPWPPLEARAQVGRLGCCIARSLCASSGRKRNKCFQLAERQKENAPRDPSKSDDVSVGSDPRKLSSGSTTVARAMDLRIAAFDSRAARGTWCVGPP